MKNLIGKLYFVYEVHEERSPAEITISRNHDDHLGTGTVKGIFASKIEAKKFAAKKEKKLR